MNVYVYVLVRVRIHMSTRLSIFYVCVNLLACV